MSEAEVISRIAMFTKPWPSIPRRREIKARRDSKYAAWRTCFNWNEASTHVTWEDTQEYGRKLTAKEGVTYRLPTEAKWEYACRAGTQSTDSFGNNDARLSDYLVGRSLRQRDRQGRALRA